MMKNSVVIAAVIGLLTCAPVWAQDKEVSLENFIDSVNQISKEFNRDFEQLTVDLDNAVQAEKVAKAKFDKMVASLDKVMGRIGDESVIWQTSEALLSQFEENRKQALAKSASASDADYWKESAKDWERQAQRLRKVRNDINSQRADLIDNKNKVMESKDIAIDQIKRHKAQKAVAQMMKVKEHLAQINAGLKSIVKKTKEIETGGSAPKG